MSNQNTNTPTQAGQLAAFPPAHGSAPFALSDDEAKLIRDAVRAVDDHEYSGLCCEGRDGKTADALVERGLMRYVGEAEVDDGDGWSTGDCAACYEATEAGRAAVALVAACPRLVPLDEIELLLAQTHEQRAAEIAAREPAGSDPDAFARPGTPSAPLLVEWPPPARSI